MIISKNRCFSLFPSWKRKWSSSNSLQNICCYFPVEKSNFPAILNWIDALMSSSKLFHKKNYMLFHTFWCNLHAAPATHMVWIPRNLESVSACSCCAWLYCAPVCMATFKWTTWLRWTQHVNINMIPKYVVTLNWVIFCVCPFMCEICNSSYNLTRILLFTNRNNILSQWCSNITFYTYHKF